MMRNYSLRDMMMGEFAALGIGGGAGLGEPGYQGSIADQSLPPGWTPNPSAYDPYYNTPGGDPFYRTLVTAARQTQEPWRVESKKSDKPVLLAQAVTNAWATDATTNLSRLPTEEEKKALIERLGKPTYDYTTSDGHTYDVYVDPTSFTEVWVARRNKPDAKQPDDKPRPPIIVEPSTPPPSAGGTSGPVPVTMPPIRGPQPASASLGDANIPPEWIFPAADRRLIQMVTGVETGNRPLNFVVNKVLLPWRNALAFAENIPLATLMGIDDALKRSLGGDYQMLQDMMPLAPAMGLAMEVIPALAYAKAWMSTSQRVGAVTRGLGTVAKANAYAFAGMGVGSGVGTGERAIPTLGPVLESALPSGERAIPTLGPVLETSLPSELSVQLKSGVLPEPTIWFWKEKPIRVIH